MSHKTVYLGIPAKKLNGAFSEEKLCSAVESIMSQYVEETAEDGNKIQCDWYSIGGRWSGAVAAVKGTDNILPTENGLFPYELFDQYDAIINNGNRGPYYVDKTEYVPIDCGKKKDIDWESIHKLDEYMTYKFFELAFNRDARFGDLPDSYVFKDDGLYIKTDDGNTFFVYKKGETFDEYVVRREIKFERAILPPDAFIGLDGEWHDDNDIWRHFEQVAMSKIMNEDLDEEEGFEQFIAETSDNPAEAAQEGFAKMFDNFLDNELGDDDYFVVLDCHSFP